MTDREAYSMIQNWWEFIGKPTTGCAAAINIAVDALRDRIENDWVSVEERLPEEHDSMFARYFGTDKWNSAMFRTLSNEVIVAGVHGDGSEFITVGMTHDGKWDRPIKITFSTITHWRPLPAFPDNTKV